MYFKEASNEISWTVNSRIKYADNMVGFIPAEGKLGLDIEAHTIVMVWYSVVSF